MKGFKKSGSFLIFFLPLFCFTQEITESIKLNQLGFYPKASKIAVVTGEGTANDFYIISFDRNDTVYKGVLGKVNKSQFSSTITRIADFTKVDKEGSYFIGIPGIGKSYKFQIADNIHHDVALSSLKGFYYQRSDISLEPEFAGKWSRPAGHADTNVLIHPSAASSEWPAGTIFPSPGGWYDAGDYNKYIVNSGITMGTLLSAYEDFPKYFGTLKIGIPESQDNIPDILNEVMYNLRWMLTMQDPFDGGVYHKCTNANFDGMVMPGITKEPRYVVQKGTAATLDFAAATAQAARIFKNFEKQFPRFADSCLIASKKAWQWSVQNPAMIYSQSEINTKYDPDISTGEYGDRFFNDEWLWAAAELFCTTKSREYYNVLSEKFKNPVSLPSWSNVAILGYYTLLRNKNNLPSYAFSVVRPMEDSLVKIADRYIKKSDSNAFKTVMGQSVRDFVWGSNAVAANQGILLINAFFLTKNRTYIDYALSNLDYLMGRNATGYCFITGAGSKSPMYPHHRPSVADGIRDPVPGLLAGGPNPGRQDKCKYTYTEPETAYEDIDCSYASNEIAINWNAPMVYLANGVEALQKLLSKK